MLCAEGQYGRDWFCTTVGPPEQQGLGWSSQEVESCRVRPLLNSQKVVSCTRG